MSATPGPWEADGSTVTADAAACGLHQPETKRCVVASTARAHAGWRWVERTDADARLIAAAPDLLAFAEAMANSGHHGFCGEGPIDDGPCTCHVRAARAAIAKATGEDA